VRNPLDRLTHRLPRPWRVAIDWIVTIVGAVAIVLAIKQWVVNPYRIPSASMEPTLHCARGESECTAQFSDRVLANRFIYRFVDPKRGDIVVFETPQHAQRECGASGTFVKRIVALPGESWEMRGGQVFINGSRLVEPYVTPERRDGDTQPPKRIPENHYFVMGDNRGSSCDSRVWGPLPRSSLIGKVFAVYFPPRRIGLR
jgi:signal peptidase I